MFDPHDLDPGGSHEASDTFEWFVGRVEASDPDALDLTTPARARALYVALCDLADELDGSDSLLPGPGPAQVHLLEVLDRDPDGNPTTTRDRGFHEWPFGSFPAPREQFVMAGRLWALERRVWFPDTASVGMFVVDLEASDDALRGAAGG